jgi:hypothetical protein
MHAMAPEYPITFDSVTRAELFGAEDAENEDIERFKSYFFFNKTYDELNAALPLRILVARKVRVRAQY